MNRSPSAERTPGPSRTRAGCLTAIVLVLIVVLLAALGPRVGQVASGKRVGILPIVGEIWASEETLTDARKLADDPSVVAMVVRLDSPGGTTGASQELYGGLSRIREESGKPLVASFGDVAASGAYYAACAADSIFTNPGTLTGSIGVILELPDYGGIMQKLGVKVQVVKSGRFKDTGSPYRDMTPEETALLQGVIDDTYAQFVDAVVESRDLPRAKVLAIADGRVMSGRQAVRAGLVDRTGDLEDAIRAAGRMAGLRQERPRTVTPHHHKWDWPWNVFFDSRWGGRAGGMARQALAGPRLLYRIP